MAKKKAPARRPKARAPARKAPVKKHAPVKHVKASVRRVVVIVKQARRKASKFKRVTSGLPKRVKNRFQKFYYLHRPDLNKFRRSSYSDKKKKGICVKCKKKSLATSIFCAYHLRKSRIYNLRR